MTTENLIKRKSFDNIPTCIADLLDKYIMVGDRIFLVRRLNEFGDSCLKLISDTDGIYNIGNIKLTSRKFFTIHFMHHGFASEAKIRYSEVRFSKD